MTYVTFIEEINRLLSHQSVWVDLH